MSQAADIDVDELKAITEEQSLTVLKLKHPAIAEDLATFQRKTEQLAETTERIDELHEQRDRTREQITELANKLLDQLDD